jgi:hypothetical protein
LPRPGVKGSTYITLISKDAHAILKLCPKSIQLQNHSPRQ